MCVVILSLFIANYFPTESLRGLVYHPQFCNVYSVLEFAIMFGLAFCINLLAMIRLAINLVPFWFARINHDALKVPIYVCISAMSLLIPATGYRLKSLVYCDNSAFHIKLIFLGFERRFYNQVFTNYPEIIIFVLLAVILHFVSVCIEWHKEMRETEVSEIHLEQTERRSNHIENPVHILLGIPTTNLSEMESTSGEPLTVSVNPSSAPVLHNHNFRHEYKEAESSLSVGSHIQASPSGGNCQSRPPIIRKEINSHGPRLDAFGLGQMMGVYDYEPSSEQVYVIGGKMNPCELEAQPNLGSEEPKHTECVMKNILKSAAKGCFLIIVMVVNLLSLVALLMTENAIMFAIADFVHFSIIKLHCVVLWSWLLLSNDDLKAFTIRHTKIWLAQIPAICNTRLADLIISWIDRLESQIPDATT